MVNENSCKWALTLTFGLSLNSFNPFNHLATTLACRFPDIRVMFWSVTLGPACTSSSAVRTNRCTCGNLPALSQIQVSYYLENRNNCEVPILPSLISEHGVQPTQIQGQWPDPWYKPTPDSTKDYCSLVIAVCNRVGMGNSFANGNNGDKIEVPICTEQSGTQNTASIWSRTVERLKQAAIGCLRMCQFLALI